MKHLFNIEPAVASTAGSFFVLFLEFFEYSFSFFLHTFSFSDFSAAKNSPAKAGLPIKQQDYSSFVDSSHE